MKAKRGYCGLESFSLSVPGKRPEVLELSGNAAQTRLINELFDSGEEEEARRVLRKALDEVTRDLDRILADGGNGREAGAKDGVNGMDGFLLSVER